MPDNSKHDKFGQRSLLGIDSIDGDTEQIKVEPDAKALRVSNFVWNTSNFSNERMTQPLVSGDPVMITDGTSVAMVDSATLGLTTITASHKKIHAGYSFTVADAQNVNSTTLNWMVTTSGTKEFHMVFDIECTGEMRAVISEDADRIGTTLLPILNRKRSSAITSGLTIHRGYTDGTTDGTTILYDRRSGNTGVGSKTVAVGGARGTQEWDLLTDTKYIISVTTYADVWVSFSLDWYEVIE